MLVVLLHLIHINTFLIFSTFPYRCEEWPDLRCVWWQWWWWWLLCECRPAASLHGDVHHGCLWQGAQGRPATQQHIWGQVGGQEASHPHAGGHCFPVLSLLDATVLCQHLEGFRWLLCQTCPLRVTHCFYPFVVLHLCLCQPNYLLLHEHTFPQSPACHFLLLCCTLPSSSSSWATGQRGGCYGNGSVHV